jgi:hypothetical protein
LSGQSSQESIYHTGMYRTSSSSYSPSYNHPSRDVLILKIRGLRQTKPEKICSMMKIQARTGLAFALGFLLTIPTLEALPFGAAGCSGGQAAVGEWRGSYCHFVHVESGDNCFRYAFRRLTSCVFLGPP